MAKLRILTVFAYPWQDSNNIGNSFSNILGDNENYEIAHVYCSTGKPQTSVCRRFFQMTEFSVLKNLFNKKYPSGKEIFVTQDNIGSFPKKLSITDRMIFYCKRYRFTIFFWLRNLIWAFGNWKSTDLNKFVDSFAPDIIFYNIDYFIYTNNIALYVQKRTKAKMVGYFWDDVYSFKQFSLSPFFGLIDL